MAKGSRARRVRPLLVPAALMALLAAPAARAEWKFSPLATVRETWTDNVALAAPEFARSEFITEVSPGFTVVNKGPRLDLRLAYQLQYFLYSDQKVNGTNRSQRELLGDVHAKLIEDLLLLDGFASRHQQSISAFGPQINNNGYSSANRTEIQTWRISPYLVHNFGSAQGQLRYTRDSVDPGNTGTGTGFGFGHSVSNTVSANLSSGERASKLGWGVLYSRQNLEDSRAGASSSETALANLSYRIASSFSLNASGGYDKYDYQALGGRTAGANWSAGFSWNPSLRTSVDASVGKRYFGSSYALNALHRSRRTVWSINYNDAVTTTRDQFLLPATIDTASLLNRMLLPNFPDPAERQRAVEAYMLSAGLPASLADSINYFSNRYILQKAFRASAAFNGTRSALVLAAFSTRRNALSIQGSDSALLGSSLSTLNDNTRQVGASATGTYQLSPRSTLNLGATWSDTRSLSTGLSTNTKMLNLGMTRQFQNRLNGSLELRHVNGSVAVEGGRVYRENAIAAALSMQL